MADYSKMMLLLLLLCILLLRDGVGGLNSSSPSLDGSLISLTVISSREGVSPSVTGLSAAEIVSIIVTISSSDTEIVSRIVTVSSSDAEIVSGIVTASSSEAESAIPFTTETEATTTQLLLPSGTTTSVPISASETVPLFSGSFEVTDTSTDQPSNGDALPPFNATTPLKESISHKPSSLVIQTTAGPQDALSTVRSTDSPTHISPSTTSSEEPLLESTVVSSPKPIVEVKKAMTTTLSPKAITKVNLTPSVVAKKCCSSGHVLEGNECFARDNTAPFKPLSHVAIDEETARYDLSWETNMLNCSEGFTKKEISFHGKTTLKADKTLSFLVWNDASSVKSISEYCIEQQTDGNYTALICVHDVEQLCGNATCIRKCCGPDEIRSYANCKGTDESHDNHDHNKDSRLNLTFYTLSGEETPAPEDLQFVSIGPDCPYKPTMVFNNFDLLSTGKLYLKDKKKILDTEHFCLDYFLEIKKNFAVYCFDSRSPVQEWKIFLSPIFMITSIVFLIILVMLHLVTRKLRNAQGLCFLAYSIALLMAYFGFFVNFKFAKYLSYVHCVFNGLFSQFSMLSAFFWLSVMCFDIWRVIRATVHCIPLSGILEKDTQKFLLYSGYAFGCPLVISLVTLIMQSLPDETTIDMIVPGFGFESCWFADELSQFIYFYSVIATLNGIGLLMLGHVIVMLCQADQGFSCFFKGRVNSRAFNRKHLSLFRQRLSLFAVMAICWFTEVLSLKIPPRDMWVVTDLLNTLQGGIVFLIFIVSKKKRQLVKSALRYHATTLASTLTKRSFHREESVDSTDTSKASYSSSPKEMTVMQAQSQPQAPRLSNQTVTPKDLNQERKKERGNDGGMVNEGFENHEEEFGANAESNSSHV